MSWFKKKIENKNGLVKVLDKCAELEKSIKEIKDDFVKREERLNNHPQVPLRYLGYFYKE